MRNYLLTISYDGTGYHGWQSQKGQLTVQDALESALYSLLGEHVQVTASGRTDEGVHALAQTVSFACDTSVPCEKFAAALNAFLPADIRALYCEYAPDGFCARRSAKRKTYVYRFYLSPRPIVFMERYALRIAEPLDCGLINKACRATEGTHDFRQFYCLGSSAKTTVRTVYECRLSEYAAHGITPAVYELTVCGDGFLYKMVRLIAGAMLRLSQGKITLDDYVAAIGGEDGRVRKIPAPSHGLTLSGVEYN